MMNVAAILALLLSSGVCAKTEFHSTAGATLQVVVCPMMAAPGGDAPSDGAPPPPPPAPKKEERQAMG
jgi:hypothetical protein